MTIQELIDQLTTIKSNYNIEGSHVRLYTTNERFSDKPVLIFDSLSGYLVITDDNKVTNKDYEKSHKEFISKIEHEEYIQQAQEEYNKLTSSIIESGLNKMRKYEGR